LAASSRICVVTSMGWGVRNVLMSRAMDVLRSRCEIRILSPFNRLSAFSERFAHLDGLDFLVEEKPNRLTMLLYHLNSLIFYKLSSSVTHRYKLQSDAVSRRGRLKKLAEWLGNQRTLRLTRWLLLKIYRRSDVYARYKRYFVEKGIDTVVTSNPLNVLEYPALIAARDLGLRTIAIITSWDNLTSKRPLVIDFDEYLVWNDVMAAEVVQFCGADRRIRQIGPLQFDFYFDDRFLADRESFCAQFRFDPGRKLVVYSTVTDALLPDEPALVEKLLLALKAGRIEGSPNLLVRLHPKRDFEAFRPLSEDRRFDGMRVAWTVAGRPVREKNDRWCPLDDEIRLLTNTVRHGDVNLNVFSTMLLDFAVLDKPAVLIGHTSDDRRLHYENYEHFRPVLACNGHRIGRCLEETIAHLNAYLREPELERDGRRALVRIQGGEFLGRSWQRLAEVILGRPIPGEAPDGPGAGGSTGPAAHESPLAAEGLSNLTPRRPPWSPKVEGDDVVRQPASRLTILERVDDAIEARDPVGERRPPGGRGPDELL